MKRAAVAVFVCLVASGCASHGPRAAYSAGEIGCPPSEIVISDGDVGWTTNTWTASCRGRVFYCTYSSSQNLNSKVTCREGLASRSRSEAVPSAAPRRDSKGSQDWVGFEKDGVRACDSTGQIAAMAHRARVDGYRSLEWLLESSDRETVTLSPLHREIAREVVRIGFNARSATEARIEAKDYCINRVQAQ